MALSVSVSVSVAVLLPETGSKMLVEMDAVFASEPLTELDTVHAAVKVAVPFTGSATFALMLPEPEAGQVPPLPPAHVQVQLCNAAGKLSVTVALVALLGPALLATIV